MARPSVDELAEAMSATVRDLTESEKLIAAHLYRALADGDPVEPESLAEPTGETDANVRVALKSWPGVFRDEHGRVIGFWGLAIPKMPHGFHAEGGKPMYAWCAIDPFLVVPVIGRQARVRSRDPITGEPIAMTVTPEGLHDVSPRDAMVSFVPPEGRIGPDVLQTFCHFVLNFASQESGNRWAAAHQGALLLTANEALRVGQTAWKSLHKKVEPTHPPETQKRLLDINRPRGAL